MREDRAKMKMGNLKQPIRQDAINWVSKAWDSIKKETLFLVCGIANALDGSEDDKASDDLPSVEVESEASDDDGDDSDDGDILDPFSEDSGSDSD